MLLSTAALVLTCAAGCGREAGDSDAPQAGSRGAPSAGDPAAHPAAPDPAAPDPAAAESAPTQSTPTDSMPTGTAPAGTASTPAAPDGTAPEASGSDDPGATQRSDGASSEILPETSDEPVVLSDLLPSDQGRPLVGGQLPAAASASGRVVAGFPGFLRPVRGTRVRTSSLSPSGDRLQVALTGTTSLPSRAVLRTYRTRFGARRLQEQEAPPTFADSQAATFARGSSSVTVTAQPEGSRTAYTVYAVLHASRG